MEPKKNTRPAKKQAEAVEVAAVEEPVATVAEEAAAVETVEAPVPKSKSKMTTTQNYRSVGEVNIEQPDQVGVDVSQVKRDDLVLVTMHETIDPAPRVGTFDCRHALGVQQLTARKNYRMPKFVAEVLVDAKKAEYLSVE